MNATVPECQRPQCPPRQEACGEGSQQWPETRRVILLHGIWMRGVAMLPMARRLRALGWQPRILDYFSIRERPHGAHRRLQAMLEQEEGATHLVGHSLGGLVALSALELHPQWPVARVVCLGTPLTGSAVARQLQAWPLTRQALGGSTSLLCEGIQTWPAHLQVGMVAGTSGPGVGRLFTRWDAPNDGTVAVPETCSEQLADHVTVPASHTGLLWSGAVAAQVDAFLRDGAFRR